MVYTKEYKQKITFEYPCYICGHVLSRARITINHLQNIHGYSLPSRAVGRRRPADPNYIAEFEAYHCACPSCWYHCPCDEEALVSLANHVHEVHKPTIVDATKNDNGNLRLPQVNYVIRSKVLPPGDEEVDELESEEEDGEQSAQNKNKAVVVVTSKGKAKASQSQNSKKKKKEATQLTINDVYQRIVDLTEMFKNLMNNNYSNANANKATGGSNSNN
ncbi:hypothetical protein MBANPS3_007648 [Mucor bainieri]